MDLQATGRGRELPYRRSSPAPAPEAVEAEVAALDATEALSGGEDWGAAVSFQADYPGAIVVEAANYGYGVLVNHPRGFVYHTPEEIADDDPQTPRYLASTTRLASYHYFVSYLGLVFQLVPEHEGAYANYVNGRPYPSWASFSINLNLQALSVSFEGMAATIHQTMKRGRSQWTAGVALVAHRAKALGINPDDWARHSDVSIARGDPGQLDIGAFTADVKAKMEDEMEQDEFNRMYAVAVETVRVRAQDAEGNRTSLQTVERWHGILQEHREDPHTGGGITKAQAVKAVKDAL